MTFGNLLEDIVVIGGTYYVVNKLTGRKRKVKSKRRKPTTKSESKRKNKRK